jgi:peptidoglycan hydrolase-like protein with peptidoglycan-binding domain
LPSALDVAAPFQGGYRCLTGERPGVVAFAKLLNATYGTHTYGIWRRCVLEHGEGRALDWMLDAKTPEGLELGNRITRWLAAPDAQGRPGAMARRFGINYIIWNRQSWRAYDPGRGWTPYFGVSPHTDHIHISFTWDGAYGRTSWWTGVPVVTPLTGPVAGAEPVVSVPTAVKTASGYPWLRQGHSGADVVLAQRVVGAVADGDFGPKTAAAVSAWQASHGVPVTGEMDNATWSRMVALKLITSRASAAAPAPTPSAAQPLAAYAGLTLKLWSKGPAVVALQKALGGLSTDGEYGPLTQAKVKAYQSTKKLPVTGEVTPAMWQVLMGKTVSIPATPTPQPQVSPLAAYAALTLSVGSSGPAVVALQKALGGLVADGRFGSLTQARVKAYQTTKKVPATGVVTPAIWVLLIGKPRVAAPAPRPASAPVAAATGSYTTAYTAVKATTLRIGSKGTAVSVLQKGLGGVAVDGNFGPATEARVKAVRATLGLPVIGVADAALWEKLEAREHPLLTYWRTSLKVGSTGAAVVALQKALKITADGNFGSGTLAAVKAAQARAKLTQTGVVALLTWQAIEAQMR